MESATSLTHYETELNDPLDPDERVFFPNLTGAMDEPLSDMLRISAGPRAGEVMQWRSPVAHIEQKQVILEQSVMEKLRAENAAYHQTSITAELQNDEADTSTELSQEVS